MKTLFFQTVEYDFYLTVSHKALYFSLSIIFFLHFSQTVKNIFFYFSEKNILNISLNIFILLQTVEYDFCLDDCVQMSRLLRSLGVPVTLDILEGLPHGFLNLSGLSPDTKRGNVVAMRRVANLLARCQAE